MDLSKKNNTGYVDLIMEYPKVLVPVSPLLILLSTGYKNKTVLPRKPTLDTPVHIKPPRIHTFRWGLCLMITP